MMMIRPNIISLFFHCDKNNSTQPIGNFHIFINVQLESIPGLWGPFNFPKPKTGGKGDLVDRLSTPTKNRVILGNRMRPRTLLTTTSYITPLLSRPLPNIATFQ